MMTADRFLLASKGMVWTLMSTLPAFHFSLLQRPTSQSRPCEALERPEAGFW